MKRERQQFNEYKDKFLSLNARCFYNDVRHLLCFQNGILVCVKTHQAEFLSSLKVGNSGRSPQISLKCLEEKCDHFLVMQIVFFFTKRQQSISLWKTPPFFPSCCSKNCINIILVVLSDKTHRFDANFQSFGIFELSFCHSLLVLLSSS